MFNAKADTNKQPLLAAGIFFLLANLFTVYFISQERYLYHWDGLTYWEKSVWLLNRIYSDMMPAAKTVFYSIREDTYNYFPALLLMPFSLAFGTSRLAYILSIVNTFAMPAACTFVLIHKELTKNQDRTLTFLFWIPLSVILLTPAFWNPVLAGFVDVGGVIATNLILLLYLKHPLGKQNIYVFLLIAVLIPMLVLFRRWYAFWGVAYYITLLLEIGLTAFVLKSFRIKKFIEIFFKYLLQGTLSAAFLFAVAPTAARKFISTDYTDLNSAYRDSANLLQSFSLILDNWGLIFFMLFILGAGIALRNKRTRKFAIFVLVQSLIMFILFARTQDFGIQHQYLFAPQIIFFASLFLNYAAYKVKNFKLLTFGTLVLFFFLNVFVAFGQKEMGCGGLLGAAFTNVRYKPPARNDIHEIERMLKALEQLSTKPEDRIYVLASSYKLNSHMLQAAHLYFNRYRDIGKKILQTSDIDKRHGFPSNLLTANYVIAAAPIQYHMHPEDQRVVGIPARLFEENKGVAASFQKLPYEFNLDGGVKAYIYKKIKPIPDSDMTALSEMLKQYYPDRENVYQFQENP